MVKNGKDSKNNGKEYFTVILGNDFPHIIREFVTHKSDR
jgi:hypothetical protein